MSLFFASLIWPSFQNFKAIDCYFFTVDVFKYVFFALVVLNQILLLSYYSATLLFFYNQVDTGRKLNVHKMFRRRPGRLLNVLCTFNLRAVSIGNKHFPKQKGTNFEASKPLNWRYIKYARTIDLLISLACWYNHRVH